MSIHDISGDRLRVVVLGAGFGGLELTTRLCEELGEQVDIVLVDRTDCFVFGFSKLDVMFGRRSPSQVRHRYADVVRPGVRFVQAEVTAIDAAARRVETTAGTFTGDVLVIALGADVDPGATPGLAEGGHEFYTEEGAFALRETLASFGGGRVVVGVTSTPFKCPPAPSEAALLVEEHLRREGVRDRSEVTLVLPLPAPIPPSPAASKALLAAFAERDITFVAGRSVRSLESTRRVVVLDDGQELPCDLFLGVPVHRVPKVVEGSGLAVDGWVPVDPVTLETRWPGVYAVGDVTSAGTPKAGVFAEGQATAVAEAIIATARDERSPAGYGGSGTCYIEFGGNQVGIVDVTFRSGETPAGELRGPSEDLTAAKAEFGSSRIRRWFGRDWSPGS